MHSACVRPQILTEKHAYTSDITLVSGSGSSSQWNLLQKCRYTQQAHSSGTAWLDHEKCMHGSSNFICKLGTKEF